MSAKRNRSAADAVKDNPRPSKKSHRESVPAPSSSSNVPVDFSEKLESFPQPARTIAKRLHEVILSANPSLTPRLWYGMPGYAKNKSSPVLCFFRTPGTDEKYYTFGLTDKATIVREVKASHELMPSAWYIDGVFGKESEEEIVKIVKRATLKKAPMKK